MADLKNSPFDKPAPILCDDDPEILAAIDEGVRDIEAGSVVTEKEVRKLLRQSIKDASRK